MNKKMFIIPLLVLVLMVGFSFSAFAEDTGIGLKVGTDEITTEKTSGDGWSYTNNEGVPTLTITGNVTLSNVNPDVPVGILIVVDGEYTVTLNNVNLKYVDNKVVEGEKKDTWGTIIYFKDGGKLNLAKGTTNTLANFDNIADDEDAITFGGNLDVSGGGSLNIDTTYGISSSSAASLSITDSVINIKTTSSGISTYEGDVSISSGSKVTITSADYSGIYANGNVSISGSKVTIESGYSGIFAYEANQVDEANKGNVSISDSNLIVRSVDPAIFSLGNITIKGKSVLDLKAVVPAKGGDTSGLSADEVTKGPDMPMYSEHGGVITASFGNISFEGPVQVTADGNESRYPIYGIAVGNGNIEFKLTPGGFVKGIGSDAMTWRELGVLAQGGIVALVESTENADALGKITLNDGNVITAPQGSTVVSGTWTNIDEQTGTYQAIGTSEAVAQEAMVECPKLNTEDHFNYIKGYADGNFRPNAALTRAECAAMLARLTEGFDETAAYTSTFSDVDKDSWYAKYVGFLETRKIVKGYGDGNFLPNKEISRAEFTTMAMNYFTWDEVVDTITFTDVPKDYWAYKAINAAYVKDFVKGYPDNTFKPADSIERQHAVILLNRALERSADVAFVDGAPAGLISFPDVTKTAVTEEAYYAIMEGANSHDYTKDAAGKETWEKLTN